MLNRTVPWIVALSISASLAACGGDGIGPPRTTPPSSTVPDARFVIEGVPYWWLIGNDLTPGQDTVSIAVTAPPETEVIDVWVARGAGQRLTLDAATGKFVGDLDISEVPPGQTDIIIAADGSNVGSGYVLFNRTHPLYFLVSTDWDFAEPGQVALDYHDQIRTNHPDMKFTHFIGPYTFTDPVLSEQRKAELASWAIARRDQHDDEIGLHIHPWCHFVESAGLTCITDQSTVNPNDPSGYTIKLEAYGQTNFETLLAKADEIFMQRGMGKPVTFRAGGWTATADTLKALANKGYIADTSANNWARMEEWIGQGTLYTWNMTNWSMITDTSQPYYPNTTDKQSGAAPNIPILEVPDNAIMVDYVTRAEMVDIFGQVWDGNELTEPRTYMMGFHPSQNMTQAEYSRVDGILDHADMYRASQHLGPVVYARLKDMPVVWPAP
jgi:hypothetical protein